VVVKWLGNSKPDVQGKTRKHVSLFPIITPDQYHIYILYSKTKIDLAKFYSAFEPGHITAKQPSQRWLLLSHMLTPSVSIYQEFEHATPQAGLPT
jgi:hypothetical protein